MYFAYKLTKLTVCLTVLEHVSEVHDCLADGHPLRLVDGDGPGQVQRHLTALSHHAPAQGQREGLVADHRHLSVVEVNHWTARVPVVIIIIDTCKEIKR